MLAIFDGQRCIDKIRVKRSEMDKKAIDATIDDYTMIVSAKIAEFLQKHR